MLHTIIDINTSLHTDKAKAWAKALLSQENHRWAV